MNAVTKTMSRTDWKLLSQQKLSLLRAIDRMDRTIREANDPTCAINTQNDLNGLLAWIDAIQDAAEIDGFAVIWLEE